MKIYKLDIDTSKPITQTLAIPQDAEQYGIAVKVLKDGQIQVSASVTIDDGGTTLTPAKTLEDGSQLFVLSSVDSGSRDVKVNVQVNPLVIPGATLTIPAWDIVEYDFTIPAGTYPQDEIDIAGYKTGARIMENSDVWVELKTPADWQDTNVDAMILLGKDGKVGQNFYNKTIQSQPLGYPLPPDVPMVNDKDITYKIDVFATSDKTVTIPDTTIGRQVNCSVKVQLDERIDAAPDAEIEYADALVDSDFEKNETEWKTITIDGVEYKLLCAKEVN